jgi:hypothetical protein
MILKGSEAAVRLILILIAIGALIAALATGTFAKKEAESRISDTIVASVAGLVIIVVLLGLIAIVLSLAGNAFCLAAPEKHGAKALAITVLILAVVEVILACLGIIAPSINLATNLFGVIESFLFLFFLRALARCINSRDLEDSVRVAMTLQGSIIGWGIVILVVVFVGIAAGSFDPSVPEGIGGNYLVGSFCCIGIILVFINLVWLIRTLMEARNEIGYYLDRNY